MEPEQTACPDGSATANVTLDLPEANTKTERTGRGFSEPRARPDNEGVTACRNTSLTHCLREALIVGFRIESPSCD